MSAIQPIPLIVEAFGTLPTVISAAYRPAGNGFGRKIGWMTAVRGSEVHTSRTVLKQLKDQGYSKVKVHCGVESKVFTIEELLA